MVLIGEGPLHASLEAANKPGLRLAGPKSAGEIAQWLSACDVFSLPSYSEGCPNVVIEALACGRPVVGSTVGAIPDLVDRTCGVLVSAGKPQELRTGLERALESDWDAEAISSRHGRSWRDAAEETLRICQMVL